MIEFKLHITSQLLYIFLLIIGDSYNSLYW